MTQFKIDTPIFVTLGKNKKKNYYLNLNGYRNWVFHLSNGIKHEFQKQIIHTEVFKAMPVFTSCKINYKIYYSQNRNFDLDNIGSVISKFFQDALVNGHKIEDDNYKIVTGVSYEFGGIDKENPRAEITINGTINT